MWNVLQRGSGIHLQPVWDLGCVVWVCWYQYRLVAFWWAGLVGDWRGRGLVVTWNTEKKKSWCILETKGHQTVSECTGTSQHSPGCAGVSVLGTFVNVVNIIHSKLSWLHPLPARRKPLPLQRMAPVSGVCVVIDVIPPASNRPINSPARKKSLLPAHGRQITHRLCWHTADC